MYEVILYSLLGGIISLFGGILLVSNSKVADGLAKYATPFAAGVLLGAAFSDLLPEALKKIDSRLILTTTLAGILGFFILERFLRFFHHHHEHKGADKTPNSLIIIGDTLHNALDGVAIGAAFLINPPTGIIAAFAVALHEIPQEIGDFGILLRNGMEKKKVIIVNVVSALATTLTAVITYGMGSSESTVIPFLLALTAGFFIYIATSDIIPEIHEEAGSKLDIRPWLLIMGAVFVIIISPIAHKYIDSHKANGSNSLHVHDDEHAHDTLE